MVELIVRPVRATIGPVHVVYLLISMATRDLVSADSCTCMSRSTGTPLASGICCYLGSANCPASVKADAVCIRDSQMCPRPLRPLTSTVGHFISASISWQATGGNSVEFEISSSWRYSFSWPFKTPVSTYTGPCGYPGVGDVVPIVGIASYLSGNMNATPPTSYPQQTETGRAYMIFESGEEGKDFDLFLEVQSFSVEEDWISGVSRISVDYSKPYADKQPFFPQGSKYVASMSSRNLQQPYQVIPWKAQLVGCCREQQTLNADGNGTWDFNLTALVDLSNSVSSMRIVTMPRHWLPAPADDTDTTAETQIEMCAIPVAPGLMHTNHGTINLPQDDYTPIDITWEVLGGSDRAVFMYRQGYPNCRMLSIRNSQAWFQNSENGLILSNFVSVGCSIGTGCALGGCAMITADISILRTPSEGSQPVTVDPAPFDCAMSLGGLTVAAGFPLTQAVNYEPGCLQMQYASPQAMQESLELRYVASSAAAQTGLLATAQGRVSYSTTAAGQDFAGLPPGAVMSASYGIQDIRIALSSGPSDSRPLQEVPYSAAQRDYGPQVGDLDPQGDALAAAGYTLIPNTNFNSGGVGGAIVGIYTYTPTAGVGVEAPPARAVTSLRLVNQDEVVTGADGVLSCPTGAADGFEMLQQNLLDESGRGGIYLLVKRGSGPPVVKVTTNGSLAVGPLWNSTSAETVMGGSVVASVTLYFQLSDETMPSRTLSWMPCTPEPLEQHVLCVAAAAAANRSVAPFAALAAADALGNPVSYYTTPARCLLLQVARKTAPPFSQCALFDSAAGVCSAPRPAAPKYVGAGPCGGCELPPFEGSRKVGGVYTARMGEEVRVPLVAINDDYQSMDLISVSFSNQSGVVGDDTPAPPARSTAAAAPAPRRGAQILSVAAGTVGTLDSPDGPGNNPNGTLIGGFVSWFPSAADGAWTGQLWYLNPKVLHPDELLMPTAGISELAVGRLYTAQPSDTVESLVATYGVSAERLIELNADLASTSPSDSLGGQTICLVANSCAAALAEAAALANGFPARR